MDRLVLLCVVLTLVGQSKAFLCYNCTSSNQQSSCGEKDPLTSYLSTTSCRTNCYKWILYSYGKEVRRGCKLPGMRPPGSSYAEYLCNNSLCNKSSMATISMTTLCAGIVSVISAMFLQH